MLNNWQLLGANLIVRREEASASEVQKLVYANKFVGRNEYGETMKGAATGYSFPWCTHGVEKGFYHDIHVWWTRPPCLLGFIEEMLIFICREANTWYERQMRKHRF